jgi:ElaB/YqjD/DUF883 family membrane-anchored ribosome-binding protein
MNQENPVSSDTPVDRLADRAHEAIDTAHDRARRLANDVSQTKRSVEDRVDDAAARTARGLHDAADRLRDRSPRGGGVVGSAVGGVADTMDQVGSYLENDAFGRLRGDLEETIRRNPLRTVAVGLGLGYMLARRLRRR